MLKTPCLHDNCVFVWQIIIKWMKKCKDKETQESLCMKSLIYVPIHITDFLKRGYDYLTLWPFKNKNNNNNNFILFTSFEKLQKSHNCFPCCFPRKKQKTKKPHWWGHQFPVFFIGGRRVGGTIQNVRHSWWKKHFLWRSPFRVSSQQEDDLSAFLYISRCFTATDLSRWRGISNSYAGQGTFLWLSFFLP